MRVFHQSTKIEVGPLQNCELRTFFLNTRELAEWRCIQLLVLYCCNILEARDMSEMLHSFAVKRPCVRCVVIGEGINSGLMTGERSVRGSKMIRSWALEIPRKDMRSVEDGIDRAHEKERECVQQLLRTTLLIRWPSFLKCYVSA